MGRVVGRRGGSRLDERVWTVVEEPILSQIQAALKWWKPRTEVKKPASPVLAVSRRDFIHATAAPDAVVKAAA